MSRPSFAHGAGIAFIFSFCGAALYATVLPLVADGGGFRLLVTLLAGAYVLYLLHSSRRSTGRVTVAVLWLAAAGGLWAATPGLALFLVLHTLLIWLLRSLYFHAGAIAALLDLGLSGLGLAAGIWAAMSSASLFLGLWCFFLVQALFVGIPRSLAQAPAAAVPETDACFQRAHRNAETALRKLSINH